MNEPDDFPRGEVLLIIWIVAGFALAILAAATM